MFAFAQRHYCARGSLYEKNFIACPMLRNASTEYKFTCVYVRVCACPSHFLSTRIQVRPLGFFTVDSLKDAADLRKDVPFGGLDDE